MPYVAPEVVQKVKQIDLLTYLKNYEPYELVHFSGNTYSTRTHDSFEDFQREMDVVEPGDRGQERTGLSDQSERI